VRSRRVANLMMFLLLITLIGSVIRQTRYLVAAGR
jgi:hypothetical protein